MENTVNSTTNTTTTTTTTTKSLAGRTTMVVGASHGLGHGIAAAFAEAGDTVIAVSRTSAQFPERLRSAIRTVVADAGDATAAATLLDRHEPSNLILVAGATPYMRPLQQQTWETFSLNWNSDVRIAFHWLRETLIKPLGPGSKIIVFSSGAALNPNGSPLSGGYAGAKATQRLITAYAQEEANRAGLDITFTAILPRFAPETSVGQSAIKAYAARNGHTYNDYLEHIDYPLLDPHLAGTTLTELTRTDAASIAPAYILDGAGLQQLP
jgi:NAD(P)-dependent dehydrogenase (short-subunit alcohol dehydrogenase family)